MDVRVGGEPQGQTVQTDFRLLVGYYCEESSYITMQLCLGSEELRPWNAQILYSTFADRVLPATITSKYLRL